MRPQTTHLTVPQLEIMKEVWRLEEATVRDVYEALRTKRSIAYTTVMTMMKTMEARGHLRKRVEGRAFVYQAVEPQSSALRRIVGDFLDKVFNGAAEPLLAHLVQERRLSQKDLDKVARMIRSKNDPAQ
ncbi:MAG: BlaI/MecI/CopY family transcriptional regulator [Acidobacteria bacterium]|nr:BlaI/MecI/CopY family transcriptional regulator [Acidobacteriota bacterium]